MPDLLTLILLFVVVCFDCFLHHFLGGGIQLLDLANYKSIVTFITIVSHDVITWQGQIT